MFMSQFFQGRRRMLCPFGTGTQLSCVYTMWVWHQSGSGRCWAIYLLRVHKDTSGVTFELNTTHTQYLISFVGRWDSHTFQCGQWAVGRGQGRFSVCQHIQWRQIIKTNAKEWKKGLLYCLCLVFHSLVGKATVPVMWISWNYIKNIQFLYKITLVMLTC